MTEAECGHGDRRTGRYVWCGYVYNAKSGGAVRDHLARSDDPERTSSLESIYCGAHTTIKGKIFSFSFRELFYFELHCTTQ